MLVIGLRGVLRPKGQLVVNGLAGGAARLERAHALPAVPRRRRDDLQRWRNQLGLHLATLMLAEGKTVTQTASACGYSSTSAFVTAFRTAFGQTPGSLYR